MPGIGRFASADTIVPDPQNPQHLNRYTYSLNSPLIFTDPAGHDVCPADLSERECSSGNNITHITELPTHNPLVTIIHNPVGSEGTNDPRAAQIVPISCTSQGCSFLPEVMPAYIARSGVLPGTSRTFMQKTIGASFSAAGTAVDMFGTTISSSYVFVQVTTGVLGGPVGPDDALVHLAYAPFDEVENIISWVGVGFVVAGDFASGASNIALQSGEIIIGQDTIFLVGTGVLGEVAGKLPIAGPTLDTIINLAVNIYDIGRLSGNIPTFVEIRGNINGTYALFYPSQTN